MNKPIEDEGAPVQGNAPLADNNQRLEDIESSGPCPAGLPLDRIKQRVTEQIVLLKMVWFGIHRGDFETASFYMEEAADSADGLAEAVQSLRRRNQLELPFSAVGDKED
jgi:hypothetical protein